MGGGHMWHVKSFAPSQQLPKGYEVGAEWGERRDGTIGIGCYYWSKPDTNECGLPRRTRWEARRDAIEHAKRSGS